LRAAVGFLAETGRSRQGGCAALGERAGAFVGVVLILLNLKLLYDRLPG
jgi:hypothetical protein